MAVADAGFDHDWDPGPPGRKKGNKSFRCVKRYSISGWQINFGIFLKTAPIVTPAQNLKHSLAQLLSLIHI